MLGFRLKKFRLILWFEVYISATRSLEQSCKEVRKGCGETMPFSTNANGAMGTKRAEESYF